MRLRPGAARTGWRLCVITGVVAMAMVTTQRAQRSDQSSAPPNFDVRTAKDAGAASYMARHVTPPTAAAGTAERAGAEARLRMLQRGVDVIDAPETGTPEVVSARAGTGFLTAPATDRVATLRGFLLANAAFYGVSPQQVATLDLVADYENPAGNMAWVEFEQRINGLPVFRGLIRGGFTARGQLARTTGQLAAGLDPATLPVFFGLSSADAVSLAAASVGWRVSSTALVQHSTEGARVRFARGPMAGEPTAWPIYFPLAPGVARLAWATEIWGDPDAFMVVLDAEDGAVLFRKNLTEYQTQPATYRIYAGDSPAPMSPSTVLPGSGTQAPYVPTVLATLTGAEGATAFNLLGWITDGTDVTDGNNVEAGLDRVAPDGVDAPVTGAGRVFDFPFNPQTEEPLTAAYQNGEVVDTFYWTNVYHDRLYLLGFTEAARNFQHDNFERGGLGNDRIRAESQDMAGTNNANFSTPVDGSRGRMQMFIFSRPTPARTSGLEHDVLLHELTHGTSNRLHNNASGLTTSMSRGMGEGWSDFYARALLSTADENPNGVYSTGGWVTNNLFPGYTDNYYYGIRRFPYAVKSSVGANGKPHNPLTFGDIDNTQIDLTNGAFPRGPVGSVNAFEVHNIGEVWAVTLLEVRARFITRLGFDTGNQRFLQFVTDGMKLDPVNPTLLQGRDSILAAANAGGGTAADLADIWAGFATRGMGVSAQVFNATLGQVVEAFDLPGVAPAGATVLSESFPNNHLDPAEFVTASFCVTNNATVTGGNVTGTLLATGGVFAPSGAQDFGTVAPATTVCRNFTFTVSATCGAKVTATLQIDETGADGRALEYRFTVGAPAAPFFLESFDTVSPPELPAGWTTRTLSGGENLWITQGVTATAPDTFPNRVRASAPAFVTDNVLDSAVIAVPFGVTQLTFRSSYNLQTSFDGGVLEISIAGGPFQDILQAGGAFESGGYTGRIATLTNPLGLRLAWTGSTSGYITTTVTLPAASAGQNVVLRWRLATDTSVSTNGWSVDTLSMSSFACSNEAPTILSHPLSQTVTTYDNATLSVVATGTTPLNYQWYQGASPSTASPLTGATSATLLTPPLASTTSYWVRVSNALSSADSDTAVVNVTNAVMAHASYDSTLKVPRCATVGAVCDSDAVLLNGRAAIVGGPEPHQPNTIHSSCADGTDGSYHLSESIDRIRVATLDGSPMAPGKTVSVDVNAWVFSSTSDRIDLYSAANASSPIWVPIGTLTPPGNGAQTLSATYALPAGSMQAVRASFRTGGSPDPCTPGIFNDHDDLVFAVDAASGTELVTNGTFNSGISGWSLFEVPDIVHNNAANGVFQYHKASPTITPSGQAVIFQQTGRPVSAGTALTAQFEVGNNDTIRKRISVLVIDADFSDLSVCTFWLEPGAPLRQYGIKTHPTRGWVNAAIQFYVASTGLGDYLLDNVSLKPDAAGSATRTECIDPTAPAVTPGAPGGPELLINGAFDGGTFAPWGPFNDLFFQVAGGVFEFFRPGTLGAHAGGVLQTTGQAMTSGQILTSTFQLGNSSNVRKRVSVLIHDLDFQDLSVCTFWLRPRQSLSTYAMRSATTKPWANATLSIYAATTGIESWIRLDNASLKRTPGSTLLGTECFEPVVLGTAAHSEGGDRSGVTLSRQPASRR